MGEYYSTRNTQPHLRRQSRGKPKPHQIALSCLSGRVAWGLAPGLEAKVAGTPVAAAAGKARDALSSCHRAGSLLTQLKSYFLALFPGSRERPPANKDSGSMLWLFISEASARVRRQTEKSRSSVFYVCNSARQANTSRCLCQTPA